MISNGTDNMVMPVAPMYGGAGNTGYGNCWGGDGWWILLLLLFAGGWGNGFGGGFGGGFGDGVMPYLWNTQTQNDVNRGFADAGLSNQISGLQSSVTTGFANAEVSGCNRAIDALNQRFTDTQFMTQNFNALTSQLAQCCCDNRLATANLSADIAREACATRTTDTQNTQSIINAINSGVQSVKDQLFSDKMDAKNDEIAQLRQENLYARGQASQIAQNQQIVDAIYNRLDSCPVGTTPVYGRTPIFTCNSNNGCGCSI